MKIFRKRAPTIVMPAEEMVYYLSSLCSYSENLKTYNKFVQCFQVSETTLIFDEQKFKEIRYGFNPSSVKNQAKEDEAIYLLQRATRRWLHRKHGRELRKQKGYMSLSGTIRQGGLRIVYSMIANSGQNRFTLTVKEMNSGTQVCNRKVISEDTEAIVKRDYKDMAFPLLGIEAYMFKVIGYNEDLNEISASILAIC